LCTVDKRVAVAAVARIIQFPQAIVTGEQVRRQVYICIGISLAWKYQKHTGV